LSTFINKCDGVFFRASRAGWPVQIVNDQLIVRSYSGRFVPAIDTAPSKPAAASNTVRDPPFIYLFFYFNFLNYVDLSLTLSKSS